MLHKSFGKWIDVSTMKMLICLRCPSPIYAYCANIMHLTWLILFFASQVLPSLMKSLAQLVVTLPPSGQDIILNELYQHVAESDDVTRKPTMVSWLQSLSYLSYQNTSKKAPKVAAKELHDSISGTTDSLSMNKISARL